MERTTINLTHKLGPGTRPGLRHISLRWTNFPLSAAALALALVSGLASGQPIQGAFDDHQNMMDQLGVKTLRRGPDPNNQTTFDEATANPFRDSMPDVLTMKDGTKVTRADQWPARRAEILEDFEREVYGRIPQNVPT